MMLCDVTDVAYALRIYRGTTADQVQFLQWPPYLTALAGPTRAVVVFVFFTNWVFVCVCVCFLRSFLTLFNNNTHKDINNSPHIFNNTQGIFLNPFDPQGTHVPPFTYLHLQETAKGECYNTLVGGGAFSTPQVGFWGG